MGELVEGRWQDAEELDVFTPNCPTCLMPMEPTDTGWACPQCNLTRVG